MSKFTYNVGEIVLRKNECFWIFPSRYIKNEEYTICSSWFSYMGEKWRLVKDPYSEITANKDTIYCCKYTDLIFRLWKRVSSHLYKTKYIVQLSLSIEDGNQFIECIGNIDSDYGCQLMFPDIRNNIFSENGLVKLFFKIQKEDIVNTPTKISNDVPGSEDEVSSEDEESTNDEGSNEDEDGRKEEKGASKDKGVKKLTQNLKQAFLDENLTDAVLKVENREFNVHKMILVSRSSVFSSMFQHDFKEKNTNVVDIPDCTAESFEVFLHYLYTGSADAISINNVYNLYCAADKYHVDDLKEKCLKFMKRNISIETFCDIITLSLRYKEPKLRKKAIGFFCENIKKIIKTVQWQRYIADYPTEANELLIKALDA